MIVNKTTEDQPIPKGKKGIIPGAPAKVSDKAKSTTQSAVAEGEITITKPKEQKQDVSTLNRNTKDTLHALDKIFDIQKIRED